MGFSRATLPEARPLRGEAGAWGHGDKVPAGGMTGVSGHSLGLRRGAGGGGHVTQTLPSPAPPPGPHVGLTGASSPKSVGATELCPIGKGPVRQHQGAQRGGKGEPGRSTQLSVRLSLTGCLCTHLYTLMSGCPPMPPPGGRHSSAKGCQGTLSPGEGRGVPALPPPRARSHPRGE